jgi:hypothetical protein
MPIPPASIIGFVTHLNGLGTAFPCPYFSVRNIWRRCQELAYMVTNSRKTGNDLEGSGRGLMVISRQLRGGKITTNLRRESRCTERKPPECEFRASPLRQCSQDFPLSPHPEQFGGPPIHPMVTDNPFPKVKSARWRNEPLISSQWWNYECMESHFHSP